MMRFPYIVALLVIILMSAGSGWTQSADKAELEKITSQNLLGTDPAESAYSLIDLSRIQWRHSYSVSYVSGGGYSGSTGLLNSTMFYEFSPKLSLALNIGIAHDPGALFNSGVQTSNTTILPGFTLDYHPSENFRMIVSYQRYMGRANPYYWDTPSWLTPYGP